MQTHETSRTGEDGRIDERRPPGVHHPNVKQCLPSSRLGTKGKDDATHQLPNLATVSSLR